MLLAICYLLYVIMSLFQSFDMFYILWLLWPCMDLWSENKQIQIQSVYNNQIVIQYDKYNKIEQYRLFNVIKYNKDTNKN